MSPSDHLEPPLPPTGRTEISRQLAQGVGQAVVINLLGAPLAFGIQIFLARLLGAESYGVFVYALSWLNVLVLGGKLGLELATIRFIPQLAAAEKWGLLRGYMRVSSQLVPAASAGMIALLYLVLALAREHISSDYLYTFIFLGPVLAVSALLDLRSAELRGWKQIGTSLWPTMLLRPLLLAAGVGAATAFGSRKLEAAEAMAVNFAALAATLFLATLLARRHRPPALSRSGPEYQTAFWLWTALTLLLLPGLSQLKEQADVIIAGFYLLSSDIGAYAAARRLSGLLAFGLTAVNTIAAPLMAELFERGDKDKLHHLLRQAAAVILAFTTAGVVLIIAGGRIILGWFGPEFPGSYEALLILTVGQVVNALCGPVGYLLLMSGHERQAVGIMGAATAGGILLLPLLIPLWGVNGAAAATAAGTVAWNVGMLVYSLRRLKLNPTVFSWRTKTGKGKAGREN